MKERTIYIVMGSGYHTIASKATTNYELAEKYCKRLCKEAQNPNTYYVNELTLVED